ncbi:unnamed protein product [Medioppia subpectinata]|uniref:UDP-glycosyltransferase n=1 Tax=Medioppia subpectinata TaxID=1979941 RepID=A0A7R9KPK0_9ACAR|nr:unnamed protein product [Medioppia subpectinata]CAG2107423.1 unnamed protein product [Medioppia subpectinata]
MPKKSLKALFIPVTAIGHVNACIGIAESLIGAGHRATFLVNKQWEGKLRQYGIDEIIREDPPGRATSASPELEAGNAFKSIGLVGPGSPIDKMVAWVTELIPFHIKCVQDMDEIIAKTVAEVQPDVIFVDRMVAMAAVERTGIPWVWVCSYNPLFQLNDDRTPPPGSGFAANSDPKEWAVFRETVNNAVKDIWREFNDYIVANGLPPLDYCQYIRAPTHLHIYAMPSELDYTDLRPVPDRCLQLDNFMRKDAHATFKVPDQLLNKPGKLIYFGLGTLVSSDLDNIQRLLAILAKSEHRFIVSKAPHIEDYELPGDNMWGDWYVPQIQPMVVLPVFADQFDNAQRLHELGYGIRLDAYKCSETELLGAIDKLLNDNELKVKLAKTSARIQSDDKIAQLPGLIEKLCDSQTK